MRWPMKKIEYPFMIRRRSKAEGGGWLVEVPDLPGCIADGETIEEAVENGSDALRSWLATAKEFKDPITAPSAGGSREGRPRGPTRAPAQAAVPKGDPPALPSAVHATCFAASCSQMPRNYHRVASAKYRAARLRADALTKVALFLPLRFAPEAGSDPRRAPPPPAASTP